MDERVYELMCMMLGYSADIGFKSFISTTPDANLRDAFDEGILFGLLLASYRSELTIAVEKISEDFKREENASRN